MTTAKAKTAAGLFGKLLEAQREAKAVEKAGRNQAQGYDYAQASDVIGEAQRALHAAGLVGYVTPGGVETREIQSQGGSAGLFVTLEATLVIVDPDSSDEPLEIGGRGTGVDYPGDKAVYKAITGAAKYLYAGALGIPFGDDPEADTAGAGQARRPAGEAPASPAAKGKLSAILNRAQVPRDRQAAIVHALAGDPPSKAGVSVLLDRLVPAEAAGPVELAAVIGALHDAAGVDPAQGAADLPDDAPTLEDAALSEAATVEQSALETPADEPPFPTADEATGEDRQADR